MATLGPNTNAPLALLSPKVILVCGEDRRHLLSHAPGTSHAFRCFEFWRLADHTLILSGMGTGCVEPLMWEITRPGIVREIVLVGTAGKMPGADVQIGRPYAIAEAWCAGTALDGELPDAPLWPRWNLSNEPTASSVSTDFFYGFAPRLTAGEYPFARGPLARHYAEHLRRGTQLVDMEVAPFYALCERFGDAGLRYVAVKGPSNELGADDQQIAETGEVMASCFAVARRLLRLT